MCFDLTGQPKVTHVEFIRYENEVVMEMTFADGFKKSFAFDMDNMLQYLALGVQEFGCSTGVNMQNGC